MSQKHQRDDRKGRLFYTKVKRHIIRIGAAVFIFTIIIAAAIEARTSFVQSVVLTRLARAMAYEVQPKENSDIRFPRGGPEDKRRGYSDMPQYLGALRADGFKIVRQASWSSELKRFAEYSGYPVYRDKKDAGLTLIDRSGSTFYTARYPERSFPEFETIPQLVVDTLRFIEDRSLLDPSTPTRNPAVNWKRLTLAGVKFAGGLVDKRIPKGGGSTLATQLEKFRHYPEGLTRSVNDKLRQMVSASTRSYLDGPETLAAQQRIILTYLNSTPLSARPGYGEVIGIADGLRVWYGTDIEDANSALSEEGHDTKARKAEVFKQVVSLLLAQRRPSYYLLESSDALAALTNKYLRLLAEARVIDSDLRDEALRVKLVFRSEPPVPHPASFVTRKAATSVQTELLQSLGVPSVYDLDRLDLTATTTFDASVQSRISDVLAKLGDRRQAQSLGMVGPRLLGSGDLSRMAYSIVVYERGIDRNMLRIRADSLNQPFDLNSGSKLILGSTAKLRTMVTYLGIIRHLHDTYEHMTVRDLWSVYDKAEDRLTRWATAYLAQTANHGLQSMLAAAMRRRYSADPYEDFFTGGALHTFENYEPLDDEESPTVEEAFVHSINLVFIRVMRDVRDYYIMENKKKDTPPGAEPTDLDKKYLARFADAEGSAYLRTFYNELRGRSSDEVLSLLADRSDQTPKRLTILFRSVIPGGPPEELRSFLARRAPYVTWNDQGLEQLYAQYHPDRYSLADRAYLAGVHPLRLWVASYLPDHPKATISDVLAASEKERQAAYAWLFQTPNGRAQEERIEIVREQAAFARILEDWHTQGYPFARLVPSLATAIGSSGDRPDALAELMGIILNDGVQLPTVNIERLNFAAGTPYETELALVPKAPKRAFAPEIARTVRHALMKVVTGGTALRLRGAFLAAGGTPLSVGGKTGTGDNRFKIFGPAHELMESRVVDRTATFVFFLGDRFYGTVTGYVAGREAANYHFTSALAVQLLKAVASGLRPLVDGQVAENSFGQLRVDSISFVSGSDEQTAPSRYAPKSH